MSSIQILPFVTEEAYAAWAGADRVVLCEAERVQGPPPLVLPEADGEFFGQAKLDYAFPAVTLTTLRDVTVRGASNMLTPPEAVLRHGLFNPDTEVGPEEANARLICNRAEGSAVWKPTDPANTGDLPEAAVFTDGLVANYAHWMTEVAPRLAAFVRCGGHAGVPLIIDANLHPNIQRSVELIAGPDAVIHRLAADAEVRVGIVHNVSPTGYVPFKLKPQPLETICHGLFGAQALQGSADQLRRAMGYAASTGPRPKLFIRRNATLRHIANEVEIGEALERRGFTTLDPGALSLEQQIAAYSNAEMVVGATGAAMANLIFCRSDCPIAVLMPRFRHTAYWYWRRIAAAAGAGPVVHVSGGQAATTEDPFHSLAVHQDFGVDLKDVLDAVDLAETLRG
jgi:capsular polysaccharide biosynthesis protein